MGRTRMGWKQILCILLVFVFVSQLVPAQVLAEVVNDTQELSVSAETVVATEETEPATIVGEMEELREENVKHFRLSDGSFIAAQYAEPVHYQAANGDWKDIDNTLTLRTVGDDQMYTAQMGKVTKRFAGDLSDGMLFEISYEDYSVGMSLIRPDAEISSPVEDSEILADAEISPAIDDTSISANTEANLPAEDSSVSSSSEAAEQAGIASVENPAAEASVIGLEPEEMSMPEKLSSGVTYSNVYSNTDIVYENSGYDIKESIIVNSPQASYSYAFAVDAENLSAELNDGGDVEFKNDEGEIVFVIPAPYMVDANGEYSDAAHYELIDKDGVLLLGLIADAEWINASERAFPVSIDPSIYLHYESTDLRVVCLRKNSPNSASPSDGSIFCGKNGSSNYGVCQMGIQVETLPTVPKNCVIVNAQMMVAYVGLFSNGSSSSSSRQITVSAYKLNNTSSDFLNLTWNGVYGSGGLGRGSTVLDYQKLSDSNLGGFVSWDVTPAAHEWYKSTNQKGALIFVSENEDSQGFYASFVGHRWYDNSPYFIVNYRNTVGIEDYYTYQTASAARAGTVYIGDCSNQLTLVNTDVSYGTEAVSAEVSHVYNTAYANQHFDNDSTDINTQNYSSMNVGLGWKLSVQQTLKKVTIGDTEYLIYNDADGTEHYFPKTATNTYKDEDGLGLKIVRSGDIYTMTDTDAYNTWTFTNYGYLIKIADSNGNTTNINYANGRIETITVQADGGTTVTVATLTYNSDNYLSEIKDYRNKTTYYSYTPGGKLQYITYADGTVVNYYYTTDGYITKTHDSESGYGLRFTYWGNGHSGKTINQVREYTASSFNSEGTNDVLGNAFHAYKPSAQLTSYRFYGQDHVSNMNDNSGDDVLVNYVFDYAGRTVCSYETDSTKAEVIGSSAASYTANSGTSGKNNRLTGAGAMGIANPTVSADGGFEIGALAKSTGSASINTISSTTDNRVHTGKKSLWITLDSTNTTGSGYIRATLQKDQTYTVSCYVLNYTVTGWDQTSSYGRIKVLNPSAVLECQSEKFTTQTSRSIERGWARVSYTFTAAQSGSYYIGMGVGGFTGMYYVDDIQIEKGELAGPTNLLLNGKPSSSSYWTMNSASYVSGTSSPFGAGVIKISGSPSSNRSAVQNVYIHDSEAGTYILSGWGKASAVGSTETEYDGSKPYFGMLAAVVYTDQSGEEWHFVPFNKDYTDWQYTSGIIVPKRDAPVSLIRVYLFYTNNANTAYFDNISLVREPCSSYSYDDKGNPVSAKEGGAKTSCEYQSGTSILTKYTASTGVVTSFTYESGTHNLLTTTSAGVTSTNTYNTKGLVTSTKSTGSNGWYNQSSAVYDSYGRKTSSTDVNNITTTNTYNNYFPKSTQTGGGAVQNYAYNSANGRLTSTSIASVATQHNVYEQGMLTRLARQSGATTSTDWQSYLFGYDSFGNMLSVSVSDAAKTGNASNSRTLATYSYDDSVHNGLLQSMTYGNNATVEYEYDIFDRTTKETYNNGVEYNYAYDASGALAKQWSSTNSSDTVMEEYRYEYDSLGRLIRSSEYNNGTFEQRTEHIYDESDRLTRQAWYNSGGAISQTYEYGTTNGLLTNVGVYLPGNTYNATPGASNTPSLGVAYTYNALNQVSRKTTSVNGNDYFYSAYWYPEIDGNKRSTQIKHFNYRKSSDDALIRGFEYTYDARGNIKTVSKATSGDPQLLETYTYDGQNQLVRCDSAVRNKSYTYTYDAAGNIQTKQEYAYTTGTLGTVTKTVNYAYNDAAWADLLTSYGTESITYDNAGNPLSYYNGTRYTFEWTQGRQLATAVKGSTSVSYDYDMAGVRSGKTVTTTNASTGATTTTHYKYTTLSGKLTRLEYNDREIDFIYDEDGRPYAMVYESSTKPKCVYYYILNAQGDVVALMNETGSVVADYTYDEWGKLISVTGSNTTMGNINPLRYRGYIYDSDTGFYYLQSRYYDPEIGRFINADTYTTTDADGLLSTNMFAYCENNPVMGSDPTGELHILAGALIGGVIGGGLELVGQLVTGTKLSDVNWGSVAIEAAAGAATGAAMSMGVPSKVTRSAINAITSVAHSINDGDSIGKAVGKLGKSLISSNKNPIGQKLLKKFNLGRVGKIIGKLTYEGKHLKYDALRSIKSDRIGRAVGRTVGKATSLFFNS